MPTTTPIEPAEAGVLGWLPGMLQLSDTFYPTGSYAHSFGLEGLVQAGQIHDLAGLRGFVLAVVLPLLERSDLPLARHAWAAADRQDWVQLEELCFLGAAVRGAREPRAASDAIGRQRIASAARLRGGIAAAFLAKAQAGAWPIPAAIAAAIEAQTLGAPADAAVAALVYAAVAALLAAAVKLLRLGQNAVQTLLTEAIAGIPADGQPPLAAIGAFCPWWDLAAARHETADFRLFIS